MKLGFKHKHKNDNFYLVYNEKKSVDSRKYEGKLRYSVEDQVASVLITNVLITKGRVLVYLYSELHANKMIMLYSMWNWLIENIYTVFVHVIVCFELQKTNIEGSKDKEIKHFFEGLLK